MAMSIPAWQNKDMSRIGDFWHKMLGDLDYKTAEAAVIKILRTKNSWPFPADILIEAKNINPPKDAPPLVDDAWIEVYKSLNSYRTEPLEYSHLVILKTVRSCGYLNLCQRENARLDFMTTYKRLSEEYLNQKENQIVKQLTNYKPLSLLTENLAAKFDANRKQINAKNPPPEIHRNVQNESKVAQTNFVSFGGNAPF